LKEGTEIKLETLVTNNNPRGIKNLPDLYIHITKIYTKARLDCQYSHKKNVYFIFKIHTRDKT